MMNINVIVHKKTHTMYTKIHFLRKNRYMLFSIVFNFLNAPFFFFSELLVILITLYLELR